jgi:hypothetical protein
MKLRISQLWVLCLFLSFLSPYSVKAEVKAGYAIGDVGPAGGFIGFVDEFDEYEWDYLELAPLNWAQHSYFYDASRALLAGQNASKTLQLSTSVGSGPKNTESIVASYGRGWEFANVARDVSDCKFPNSTIKGCKITITFKAPHGVTSFAADGYDSILPVMCSGKLVTFIVNSGTVTVGSPNSIYFYENVATADFYSKVNASSGCKISYQALMADEAIISGFSDWFLPSLDELTLIQKATLDKGIFSQFAEYYPSSNFKDANTQYLWGFNYTSNPSRIGQRLTVDIKYGSKLLLARTFKTSVPVTSISYPKGCPSDWNANTLVDVEKLKSGNANGVLKKLSEKDKFEVIAEWTVQRSKDGINYKNLEVKGPPIATADQSFLRSSLEQLAGQDLYYRYVLNVEKKDCPKSTIYSSAYIFKAPEIKWTRTSTVDTFVKARPTLFPTFKEVDQLNKSLAEIREWFSSFNRGEKKDCYREDGTAGVYLFIEGHLFGCRSDFGSLPFSAQNGAVEYNWRTIRVAPFDSSSCKADVDSQISPNSNSISVITEFGQPRQLPGYFVSSKTKCQIGIFLYDSWGWYWLENITLNDLELTATRQLAVKKAAEEKAAAEAKAKAEAEAKAAADKAAAEAKAALEKAAEEARVKAELEAKAKAEADAQALAKARAEAEAKAKAEAEAKAAAQSKSKTLKTITCVKGKVVKKVTAVNPKCPKGFKRR